LLLVSNASYVSKSNTPLFFGAALDLSLLGDFYSLRAMLSIKSFIYATIFVYILPHIEASKSMCVCAFKPLVNTNEFMTLAQFGILIVQ
jgi:hypothetical protein